MNGFSPYHSTHALLPRLQALDAIALNRLDLCGELLGKVGLSRLLPISDSQSPHPLVKPVLCLLSGLFFIFLDTHRELCHRSSPQTVPALGKVVTDPRVPRRSVVPPYHSVLFPFHTDLHIERLLRSLEDCLHDCIRFVFGDIDNRLGVRLFDIESLDTCHWMDTDDRMNAVGLWTTNIRVLVDITLRPVCSRIEGLQSLEILDLAR